MRLLMLAAVAAGGALAGHDALAPRASAGPIIHEGGSDWCSRRSRAEGRGSLAACRRRVARYSARRSEFDFAAGAPARRNFWARPHLRRKLKKVRRRLDFDEKSHAVVVAAPPRAAASKALVVREPSKQARPKVSKRVAMPRGGGIFSWGRLATLISCVTGASAVQPVASRGVVPLTGVDTARNVADFVGGGTFDAPTASEAPATKKKKKC